MSTTAEATADKIDTPALEQLVRARYPRDKYALFFDVPDAVGVSSHRRIDAIAIGCWKTSGREIEGFELKVSRSDWLRELKQVDKADPFVARCDRFWLVTADTSIAKLEEIPACWGWLAVTKGALRVQRPATRLPGAGDTVDRNFMIGILRKLQDDLLTNPDVQALITEKVGNFTQRVTRDVEYQTRSVQRRFDDLEQRVKQFENESGLAMSGWRMGNIGKIVQQLQQLGYGTDRFDQVDGLLERQENLLSSTLQQIQRTRSVLNDHKACSGRPDGPCSARRSEPAGENVGGEVLGAPGGGTHIAGEGSGSEGASVVEQGNGDRATVQEA